jgi:hypothetical protein
MRYADQIVAVDDYMRNGFLPVYIDVAKNILNMFIKYTRIIETTFIRK